MQKKKTARISAVHAANLPVIYPRACNARKGASACPPSYDQGCVFYNSHGDGYCQKSACLSDADCDDGLTDTCVHTGGAKYGECACGRNNVSCTAPYSSSCQHGRCHCGSMPQQQLCAVGTVCDATASKCVPVE